MWCLLASGLLAYHLLFSKPTGKGAVGVGPVGMGSVGMGSIGLGFDGLRPQIH